MAFPERMFEREMKMVKKTLIALAVVALLTTSAHAALSEWYFEKTGDGGHSSVKVDGKDQPTFRWPYSVSYEKLDICTIPITMKVGMFVQIYECSKKKIVLEQVDCGVIGKGSGDYPCYEGYVNLTVRSNFNARLGTSLNRNDGVISHNDHWTAYFDNTDVVIGDGTDQQMKLVVEAWKVALYKETAGDDVSVGSVTITVKPN